MRKYDFVELTIITIGKLFTERTAFKKGYLVWLIFHLVVLFFFGDYDDFETPQDSYQGQFWPFQNDNPERYDWFEFITYALAPILVGVIVTFQKQEPKEES